MSDSPAPAKSTEELFRQYAWDYFSLHADHRLRAFHFYILLSTALLGGFALTVKGAGAPQGWMSVFGLLLVFFSFVFWKMDARTRQLVKNGENALKFLDDQHGLEDRDGLPHPLRLFSREAEMSRRLAVFPVLSGHFTYARCFRWVFAMFAIVGAASAVASFAFAQA
jgi:hypothetical protein